MLIQNLSNKLSYGHIARIKGEISGLVARVTLCCSRKSSKGTE
jgi:hypothetical protein